MSKWEMVRLGDVFEQQITGEWGNESLDSNGVKVIRTTNFTNIGIIDYSNVAVREISNVKIINKKLAPGDIIIEKSGGSDNQPVGRVVYFADNNAIYLCNNFTQALRTNAKIAFSRYVFYFLFFQLLNHEYYS